MTPCVQEPRPRPARYRICPLAPHDVIVCGLRVPAVGVEVEVDASPSEAIDLDILERIGRTGICRIERLPAPADA